MQIFNDIFSGEKVSSRKNLVVIIRVPIVPDIIKNTAG